MANNVKEELAIWCSKRHIAGPQYIVNEIKLHKNKIQFEARLIIQCAKETFQAVGIGGSKKEARMIAAKYVYELMSNAGVIGIHFEKNKFQKSSKIVNDSKEIDADEVVLIPCKSKVPDIIDLTEDITPKKLPDSHNTNHKSVANNKNLDNVAASSGVIQLTNSKRKLINTEEQCCSQKKLKKNVEDVSTSNNLHLAFVSKNTAEQLDDEIWKHYFALKQDDRDLDDKMQIMQELNNCIAQQFGAYAGFYVFGSSISGLGSYDSDMDMCLIIPHPLLYEENLKNEKREFCISSLKRLRSLLYRYVKFNGFGSGMKCSAIHLIPAKVPILKLVHVNYRSLNIEIDININNTAGLRNSHLLHYYAMIDQRVRALVLAVKHWAIKADIASPVNGTLSGLALTLMVVHFFQKSIDNLPPILPNLQLCLPQYFNVRSDIQHLKVFDQSLLPLAAWQGANANNMSVSKLLIEFFQYYSNHVDFKKQSISINSDGQLKNRNFQAEAKLDDSKHKKPEHHNFMYVEEPFDGSNCARCVFTLKNYEKIKTAFSQAVQRIENYKNLQALDIRFQARRF